MDQMKGFLIVTNRKLGYDLLDRCATRYWWGRSARSVMHWRRHLAERAVWVAPQATKHSKTRMTGSGPDVRPASKIERLQPVCSGRLMARGRLCSECCRPPHTPQKHDSASSGRRRKTASGKSAKPSHTRGMSPVEAFNNSRGPGDLPTYDSH